MHSRDSDNGGQTLTNIFAVIFFYILHNINDYYYLLFQLQNQVVEDQENQVLIENHDRHTVQNNLKNLRLNLKSTSISVSTKEWNYQNH